VLEERGLACSSRADEDNVADVLRASRFRSGGEV
jgi:hypothetical protein